MNPSSPRWPASANKPLSFPPAPASQVLVFVAAGSRTCILITVGFIGGREKGRGSAKALRSARLIICPGDMIRDVFDPTAIQDEPRLSHHVFKFILIELDTTPLLGHVNLLTAGELKLGPVWGPNHMLLLLQLSVDGHDDLVNVGPGHCALDFPKAP